MSVIVCADDTIIAGTIEMFDALKAQQKKAQQKKAQRPGKKRLVELDALRGVACISVILFHYTSYYESTWQHSQTPLILFEYGRYGVELFFIISGFVIFMSLRNKRVEDFLRLRFWRLFPAYWVAISVSFLIGQWIRLSPEIPVHGNLSYFEFLLNFTMIPTVFAARYVDSSHWTLGFELLFYGVVSVICLRSRFKDASSICPFG